MKKYFLAALVAASPAGATCVLQNDGQPVDPVTKECNDIYSQQRFDKLHDKPRAIANCIVAHNYYKVAK
jgi:hypothetical protein